jgi:hypothetical protein
VQRGQPALRATQISSGKNDAGACDADADLAEDFPVAQFDSRPGRGPTSIVAVIPATS